MKKLISVSVLLLFVVSIFSASSIAADKKAQTKALKQAKVEVYYFHFTRRCATCKAVEAETQKAIAALYPVQSKNGLITFKSINLDENSSAALAKKCNASGQALLVLSGGKRFDLTEQGFMYALNKPEKLKEELKKGIDPFIK